MNVLNTYWKEDKRLSKLGLAVSPTTTLSKIDEITIAHDADIKRWRDEIVKAIETSTIKYSLFYLLSNIILYADNFPLALALSYQIIGWICTKLLATRPWSIWAKIV